MQADSEKLRQAWIKAVQNSIATAFRDKGDEGEVKTKHTQRDGVNKSCAETGAVLNNFKASLRMLTLKF